MWIASSLVLQFSATTFEVTEILATVHAYFLTITASALASVSESFQFRRVGYVAVATAVEATRRLCENEWKRRYNTEHIYTGTWNTVAT